ncbi:phage baseplate assembly protein V [Acinetobacter sp. ANC 3781]|uniref:phage baseplate assembly protein V n=1 Tax=Acinetobacter sp. ANC 3781 TaxID=2529835 RepID=UPI00202F3E76|nr:phage baseplate assembly protein V [Acinetobacter sp. ANC 3781]
MTNQLLRQFQNLSSIGTVIAIDASAWKIRLKIDENETDWIPIPTMAAGIVKVWRCPSLGEQFSVSAQGGELTSAVPQISLFSDAFPPPSTDPNEVFVQIGEHFLSVNIESGEALFKLNKCTFDVPETIFTGSVHAEKAISSNEDVTAKEVSLVKHPHGNVMNGPGQTTQPLPTGGVSHD